MSLGKITHSQADRFKRLVYPKLALVLRSAMYLTKHIQEAEDLAQETMIKAMRAIDTFKDGTDIKAWLLTILRRTHIDRTRSKSSKPNEVLFDEAVPEGIVEEDYTSGDYDEHWDQPEQLMSQFEDEDIIEALRMLSEETRWTLLLVDIEQMDHADAAIVLGVAVGTVKSRAHRGRAKLRDKLYDLAIHRKWIEAKEPTI